MPRWPVAVSKRQFALALPGLIALTGSWAYVSGGRTTAQARLVLPLYPMNLGEGKAGQIVDGTFEIRNGGTAPLRFEITPSCGCSEMRPTSGTLAPRESQQVFVGIRIGTEELKSVAATIQSNDPDRPSAVYSILASRRSPLQVVPDRVQLGGSAPREATLRVLGPKGKALDDPGVVRFVSTNPRFQVERLGGDGGKLSLRVSLDREAPPGHHTGAIELRVPEEAEVVEALVTAEVLGTINVVPASLILQKDPETGAIREASLMVWRPDGGSLGPVVETEAPPGITVEEATKADERIRRFRVRFPADLPVGLDRIRLRFQSVQEPAVVRLVPPTSQAQSGPAPGAGSRNLNSPERSQP